MSDHLTSEVIGFRQWRVDDDLRLCSGVIDYQWLPGVNHASCELAQTILGRRELEGCGECPGKHCHCGLYALHAPDFWYGSHAMSSFDPMVSGLVAGWGKVQVHIDGFRAEHARIVAIATPQEKRAAILAREVAREYGVPTVPQDELERVASEFGQTVPKDLRPDRETREQALARTYGQVSGGYHYLGGNAAFTPVASALLPSQQSYHYGNHYGQIISGPTSAPFHYHSASFTLEPPEPPTAAPPGPAWLFKGPALVSIGAGLTNAGVLAADPNIPSAVAATLCLGLGRWQWRKFRRHYPRKARS